MSNKPTDELETQLQAILEKAISEDAMKIVNKQVDGILERIEDDLLYRMKDDLASNLCSWVCDMAEKTVTAILEGNEEEMRRLLSCGSYGWTGRSTGFSSANRDISNWHSIIHSEFFEQGCILLRKKIVDAHRELLVNERILDLEDQVKSLVAQVNKANTEKDRMWERVKACEPAF